MENSRSKGILVIKINKPYKIAVSGKLVDSNILICHEPIGIKGDDIAYELEHYLRVAVFSVMNNEKIKKEYNEKDLKKEDDEIFYDKEKPSDIEVTKNAIALQYTFSFQTGWVKLNDFMKMFQGIIEAGFLKSEHGETVTLPIWQEIKRDERELIAFKYCAFFLNPYQKLLTLGKIMEKNITKNPIIESDQQ